MNKNLISGILGFALGAGIGVLATKTYFNEYYQRIKQEEMESLRRAYGRKRIKKVAEENAHEAIPGIKGKPEILRRSVDPGEKQRYHNIMRTLGYDTAHEDAETEDHPSDADPYVIEPEEFDTLEDYQTISLTYYSDGVLADENDHALTDSEIEASVGSGSLSHFGEYEDDSVFVRNERRKVDYEILRDEVTYEEATRLKPYARENYSAD